MLAVLLNMNFERLFRQALNSLYSVEKELIRIPRMSAKHKLNLFDKDILQILYHASQVLILTGCHVLEHIHLKYCKKLLKDKHNAAIW
jgi:hypothetical protein